VGARRDVARRSKQIYFQLVKIQLQLERTLVHQKNKNLRDVNQSIQARAKEIISITITVPTVENIIINMVSRILKIRRPLKRI